MDWIHSAAILLLCILLLLKGNPCPRSLTCSHKQRRAQSVFSWLEASVPEFHSDTFRQGSVHNWDVQLSSSGNTDSIKSCWFTSVLLPPQPFRGNFKDKKKKKKNKTEKETDKKARWKSFFFFPEHKYFCFRFYTKSRSTEVSFVFLVPEFTNPPGTLSDVNEVLRT